MRTSNTIARWLRPYVFPADITKGTRPTALEVYHVNVNDKQAPVHTFSLEDMDEGGLADVVDAVDQALTTDAGGLSGLQRYMLVCVAGEGDEQRMLGRLPVRYRGQAADDDADDTVSSEPANARGLLAQSQRHTEAFARMAISQTATIAGVQERMIARLAEMNERLTEKHVEVLQLVEELSSEKHTRAIETTREEGKQATRQIFAKQMMPMLATLVRKYTGGSPAGALPAEVVQVKTLFESLTEEQQVQLQSILTPAQVIAVVDLMDKFEGQQQQETKPPPNGH